MDFEGARAAVSAHLSEVFRGEPVSPSVRAYGWETLDAFFPEINWKGVLGVHIFKVDKLSGVVMPLSLGQFLSVSAPVQIGPWPKSQMQPLGSAPMDAVPPALTAAAGAVSGAMLALVPTPEDAARLAIEGGEAAAELHCTVLYLGDDATQIDDATRESLIEWAKEVAVLWVSADAHAFAPAFFNPDGEEPCLTLVLSGSDLAEFHDTAEADFAPLLELPEQHTPYIPHVTLAYLDPPYDGEIMMSGEPTSLVGLTGLMMERVGPISFDRIRLAFAGEVTDIELGTGDVTVLDPAAAAATEEPADATELPPTEPTQPEPALVAAIRPERERFEGCPYCGSDIPDAHAADCSEARHTWPTGL